jgi:hypothetical protein
VPVDRGHDDVRLAGLMRRRRRLRRRIDVTRNLFVLAMFEDLPMTTLATAVLIGEPIGTLFADDADLKTMIVSTMVSTMLFGYKVAQVRLRV